MAMKIDELVDYIEDYYFEAIAIISTGRKPYVPLIEGPPGVGKTEGINQAGIRLASRVSNWHGVFDFRLADKEMADMNGIPFPGENGMFDYMPCSLLPHDPNSAGIFLLDEVTQANTMMWNAATNLFYDRRAGGYKLPDRWIVVMAGNRQEDHAGVSEMPEHAKDRLARIEVEVDLSVWDKWAAQNGIIDIVRAYVGRNPGALHDFQPGAFASATPRSWAFVSDVLKGDYKDHTKTKLIEALVGPSHANAISNMFLEMKSLATMEQIINNPEKAEVPNSFALQEKQIRRVVRHTNANNAEKMCAYLLRFPPEVAKNSVIEAAKNYNRTFWDHKPCVDLNETLSKM